MVDLNGHEAGKADTAKENLQPIGILYSERGDLSKTGNPLSFIELARYMCLVTDKNLPVPDNTRGGIGTGRTQYRPQGVLMKKEISVFLLLFLFLLLPSSSCYSAQWKLRPRPSPISRLGEVN